jgi:hypothetical protein
MVQNNQNPIPVDWTIFLSGKGGGVAGTRAFFVKIVKGPGPVHFVKKV